MMKRLLLQLASLIWHNGLLLIVTCLLIKIQCEVTVDPRIITYPGDVSLGLFVNSHLPYLNRCSDKFNLDAIENAMAAIWTVHQINLQSRSVRDFRIGVYLYDTCSLKDVAFRQTVRLLSHEDDVKPKNCSSVKGAPLIGNTLLCLDSINFFK